MIKKFLIMICFFSLMQSCSEDEMITPSGSEPVLSEHDLSKNDTPYDNRIMEYWNDYKLLTFYHFDYMEFWWTPTTDIRPVYKSGVTKAGYEAVQGREEYVEQLLKLIDDEFFAYYDKKFLKNNMPKKMLLTSELNQVFSEAVPLEQAPRVKLYSYAVYDRMAVNMANEDVVKMTSEEIKKFRGSINSTLLLWQIDRQIITSPMSFHSLTDYSKKITITTAAGIKAIYDNGLLFYNKNSTISDWKAYVEAIVTHSYDELTGEIDSKLFKPGTTTIDPTKYSTCDPYLGMLNKSTTKGWNSKGIVGQKYDILISYFKEKHAVDLQAIGNGGIQKNSLK